VKCGTGTNIWAIRMSEDVNVLGSKGDVSDSTLATFRVITNFSIHSAAVH
jgi:hypothetical protein